MPPSEEKFLLKDHLFNRKKIAFLADLFHLPNAWVDDVVAGFPERELKVRIAWVADNLERVLPSDFRQMAGEIEACLPPPLDPNKTDDDFGDFIFAPLGVLTERHGLSEPERALDLIEELTQRFSMEFAIRPFLNAYQDKTLSRLDAWCTHPNYHVRRLVSEGTRSRLPWATKIDLDPMRPLPLLEQLHGDETRYVTRSVANHMGDIAKLDLGVACNTLSGWREAGRQRADELNWMIRHALRAQIKAGAPEAMRCIGVEPGAPVKGISLSIAPKSVKIGDAADIAVTLTPKKSGTLVIDYEMTFSTSSGKPRRKVFKLKSMDVKADEEIRLSKSHRFKGGATTFTLYPGPHQISLMVNGVKRATSAFELLA